MTSPKLPGGIEKAMLQYREANYQTVAGYEAALRREIAAAMEERAADALLNCGRIKWANEALRRAAAIRKGDADA